MAQLPSIEYKLHEGMSFALSVSFTAVCLAPRIASGTQQASIC